MSEYRTEVQYGKVTSVSVYEGKHRKATIFATWETTIDQLMSEAHAMVSLLRAAKPVENPTPEL